jgi:dTDP-4-amino-4,6-dideoxygalactose transaminase
VLSAICRYGGRFVPGLDAIVEECRRRGQLVQGPRIAEFEDEFARRLGGGRAVATSYGRTAAYSILKALGLPPGSEVVFPALTFWVVPEMARRAGLRVVFADVDPRTFNLDPDALERAVTPRTRAVVPTHIYGLPCDMDEILAVARRHGLRVVEDCAHAVGATYRGRPMGTFGDAALFSFQVLKPLNTFGGGMAFTRDRDLGDRLASMAAAEPWPEERAVRGRIRTGKLERFLMRPPAFSLTGYPLLLAASFLHARPDVYMWEKVRPLDPFPPSYRARYSNVQAALGLAGLDRLSEWTGCSRANARLLTRHLAGLPGVIPPPEPGDRVHVYYQYAAYVPDRAALVRRALRRGLDLESHHMDVCPDLPLFAESKIDACGARRTAESVQIPVHPGLGPPAMERVASRVRAALDAGSAPTRAAEAKAPR